MKKLLLLFLLGLSAIGFAGCNNVSVTPETLSSKDSLATLAYLSGNFLDMSFTQENQTVSYRLLSDITTELEDETEVEDELDEINQYVDLLKAFMENGATDFASITDEVSDRLEYDNKISITVDEDVYVLYYSISNTNQITGIFVIGDQEYQIQASNYLEDSDEFEQDDDFDDDDEEFDNEDEDEDEDDEFNDEDDDDNDELSFNVSDNRGILDSVSGATTTETPTTETSTESTTTEEVTTTTETTTESTTTDEVTSTENITTEPNTTTEEETTTEEVTTTEETTSQFQETERKMELIATNGDDSIKITYKQANEENEAKTEFEIEKNINGIESEVSVQIKYEQNEYKVEIEDGDNSYEFKREMENGKTTYKLEYEVNGVEGEIKITETKNELGETVYQYKIEEEGKRKDIEKEEPWQKGHDEDHDEDDETEETSFIL